MPVLLRVTVEKPCESLADAIQTALDLDCVGEPVDIVSEDGRVLVDGRSLRRRMSEACSSN
jgi:hypothetical protein